MMKSHQVLLCFALLMLSSFSGLTEASASVTPEAGPPGFVSTIGCGSVLAGYILPACVSTTASSTVTLVALTITELPIGGDGFGPSHTPIFASSSSDILAAPTSSTLATIVSGPITTVTVSLPLITRTQTVSEVITQSVTTATAMCLIGNEDDGILVDCTKTIAAPIPTMPSKSAAIPRAANPFKSITSSGVWKAVRSLGSSTHDVYHKVLRREVSTECAYDILGFAFSGVFGLFFISIIVQGLIDWRNGKGISTTVQVQGYFTLGIFSVVLAESVSCVHYC